MVEAEKQRKPGAQAFWPKVVLKKWLNLRSKDAKFDADEEDDLDDGDQEDNCGCDGDGGVEAPGESFVSVLLGFCLFFQAGIGEVFFPDSQLAGEKCSFGLLVYPLLG